MCVGILVKVTDRFEIIGTYLVMYYGQGEQNNILLCSLYREITHAVLLLFMLNS